jgi:hypothetical protein
MGRAAVLLVVLVLMSVAGPAAHAQDQPPPIGPFVLDVRGSVPRFSGSQALAESRGLAAGELPGAGFGADAGAHLYLFKWRAITFGLGGQVTFGRSRSRGRQEGGIVVERAVTERFTAVAPQLSFNFGTGNGWSYISGGIGPAVLSIVPDGRRSSAADDERLMTVNYGGGARWFTRPHLAFTFDVRFYAFPAGTPHAGFPGSPPFTLFVAGAGISIK